MLKFRVDRGRCGASRRHRYSCLKVVSVNSLHARLCLEIIFGVVDQVLFG